MSITSCGGGHDVKPLSSYRKGKRLSRIAKLLFILDEKKPNCGK